MRIGFIGAGIMGHGMALNLVRAGHDVTVIAHRNRGPIEDLVSKGASEAGSLAALAHGKGAIVMCVTGTPAARSVITALAAHLEPGTLVIDTTTNAHDGPADLAAIVEGAGAHYVEAPLTGGAKQAMDRMLGAILGCDESLVEPASAVLSCFCKQIEHFGPVGMGAKAKLVSNFLALGTAALVIEAFRSARAQGIDWKKLYELAQLGSGNSSGLQRIIGNAVDGDFGGYVFTVDNTVKDFTYICALVGETADSPNLAPVMKAIFEHAVDAGHGDKLVSELLAPEVGG